MPEVTRKTKRLVADCPPVLASAAQAAAEQGMCSVSDIVRSALARDLRERGLMPNEKKEVAA